MTSVLAQLAPLLAEPSLVDDVLARLTEWIARESQCERARLFRVDRSRLELHCNVSRGSDTYAIRLPADRGLHGQVILNQAPQTGRSPDSGEVLMVVPVYAPSSVPGREVDVIGVLEVANKRSGQPFQADDEERVAGIARQVAEVLTYAGLDDSRRAPERITGVIGSSAAMRTLYSNVFEAARSDVPLSIVGEHGTGKTLIARAIHHLSQRRHLPFVEVGFHTEAGLLEAEIFGYSGDDAAGALRRAQGGSLLIEHIDILSPASGARLVEHAQQFRVRLITTLIPGGQAQAQALGSTQLRLAVPTLAERGPDDISSLARHFARTWAKRYQRSAASVDDEALGRLRAQAWGGNVAALEQCVQQAVLACPNSKLGAADLSLPGGSTNGAANDSIPSGLLLADAEERYILRTLEENNENRTRTASSLGIGRNTLVRKIKQYRNK